MHPSYLDSKGIVALWREGLLARKVLEGKTKGYTNHPQLLRFKNAPDPLSSIDSYLEAVVVEATKRGYSFDASKIRIGLRAPKMRVTEGQLAHELRHLQNKLVVRDPNRLESVQDLVSPKPHPLFRTVAGEIEGWERVYDA